MVAVFSLMVHEVWLFNESKAYWATYTQASIFHAEQKVGLEQILILRPTSHAVSSQARSSRVSSKVILPCTLHCVRVGIPGHFIGAAHNSWYVAYVVAFFSPYARIDADVKRL
jgi:hypothetical protein